jgi:hypothetical protein
MPIVVDDKEFAAVSALPPAERYAHFVKRVADTEEIWSLRGHEGWVLAGDGERELVPVWPHARYAAACATGVWSGAEPSTIALEEWLEAWSRGIARDGRGISVFPLPAGPGVVTEASRLRDDLLLELQQYD